MTTFLSIQNTYQEVQVALFSDQNLIDGITVDKAIASKRIISMLDNLLHKNGIQLNDISFIAVNQGPGPFTSLRIVIASVNGISFAQDIPLIGIDGLKALLAETRDPDYPNTVALLNAFNGDVYFAIESPDSERSKSGYKKIGALLTELQTTMAGCTIRFIGNATALYRTEIKNRFGDNAFIPEQLPQTCSIEQIGIMGFEKWKENPIGVEQLLPLYLKKHVTQEID
jgi:tRNA threonylcarbamoyladenosine biosynthesis protein TsaB